MDLSVCCIGLCVFSQSVLSVCLFVYPVSHLSLTARILLEKTFTLHEAVGSVCVSFRSPLAPRQIDRSGIDLVINGIDAV